MIISFVNLTERSSPQLAYYFVSVSNAVVKQNFWIAFSIGKITLCVNPSGSYIIDLIVC